MPNARRNLSQALYNLRHAIQEGQAEPHFLLATYSAIRFNQESDHWVDVTALASLLATCRDHQHPTLVRCDPCKDRLERAARLCQGAFLDGFTLDGCPAFAEWALVEQKRSTRLSTAVLAALARCHEHCRDHGRALACARRCVRLAPWREPAHRQLMRSLAFTGQRRAALAHYQTWSRKLKEGLGLEPAPETVALAERIHDGLAPANP
jgi:DNA-binding SARP family transcriptional activator